MNPLHQYLVGLLDDQVQKRTIVVFYDPRREFEEFVGELPAAGEAPEGLTRVSLGQRQVYLARHEGSLFAVRAAAEAVTSGARPEPTVLYLPGVSWSEFGSPLLELERAGTSWKPSLKGLARHALLTRFSEGEVDQTLAAEGLRYRDLARLLEQAEAGGRASVLKTLFPGLSSENLLAQWLADPARDGEVESKGAQAELRAMLTSRLGLALADTIPLAELRDRALRYVLINEFRSDLRGTAPASMAQVPSPPSATHLDRARAVALQLRRAHADRYPDLADRLESDFRVCEAGIPPGELGSIDTFRCEEAMLLTWCARLVAEGRHDEALQAVAERVDSFWTAQDLRRRAQWELVRALADLGLEVQRVRAELPRAGTAPGSWVASYAGSSRWHQADRLLREVEARVVALDDEPECEEALGRIRRAYEDLMEQMARGFTAALASAGWSVTGVLSQSNVFDKVVSRAPGRTAYFLVDALRFEMGHELARLLPEALELQVQPAIASLPSITPVGMASLMPGAAGGFNVVAHKGRVVGAVDGTPLGSATDRMNYFRTRVPDLVDLTLGELQNHNSKKLAVRLKNASLVVVRSTEIDQSGESDADFIARTIMDRVVPNLARAIRKLGQAGIQHFVVSADHGYLFASRKDEDMRLDAPAGQTLETHRRCWIGQAGTPPPGAVRVTGAELGYATDLDFVFPQGAAVFRAGGSLSYHHGGPSLQEMVVPVLSFRLPVQAAPAAAKVSIELEGLPEKVTNRIFSVRLRVTGDLFTEDAVPIRIVLLSANEQVGQAGMALGGQLDLDTSVVLVPPGAEVNVGMRLAAEDVSAIQVVALDPTTDAVLRSSKEIPVRLGI